MSSRKPEDSRTPTKVISKEQLDAALKTFDDTEPSPLRQLNDKLTVENAKLRYELKRVRRLPKEIVLDLLKPGLTAETRVILVEFAKRYAAALRG